MTSIMVQRRRRRIRKKVQSFYSCNPPSSYSYSRLGFTSAGWTYTIIAALGVVGFYKFAPSPDEDNYVTRYISHYFTPSSSWAATNDRHLEMAASLQEATQLSHGGQRSHIHRYRYPQYVLRSQISPSLDAHC
jgi:hypothetical protein